jgi:polyisoprenyl-phosphate glycosyltransferase
MSEQKKLISIVVPVYNEAPNIDRFHEAVSRAIAPLEERYDFEFIFTDNHSEDDTFPILEKLAARFANIRVFRFSRNFGFQKSIQTGYLKARGAAAIQMDCDLQDPPEMISKFLQAWEDGYRVVFGVRETRKEGFFITKLREFFYWLINFVSDDEIPRNAGDFRLIDRCILQEIAKVKDTNIYLRGRIASMGFAQLGIPYERQERTLGESKFSVRQLVSLALDGILSQSIMPLRIATLSGLAVCSATILAIAYYAVGKYIWGMSWPQGFTTTIVLILFGIGLNGLLLGVIGEYLARIYKQLKFSHETIIERELPYTDPNPQSRPDTE